MIDFVLASTSFLFLTSTKSMKLPMKNKILAVLFIGVLSFSFAGCGFNNENNQPVAVTNTTKAAPKFTGGKIPLEYPIVATTAKAGDFVFAPSEGNINALFKNDKIGSSMNFVVAKMITPKDGESAILDLSAKDPKKDERTVPNSLIIPVPQGQTTKAGNNVLAWRKDDFKMMKAIVLDGGDAPKVRFLDAFEKTITSEDGKNTVSGQIGLDTSAGHEQEKLSSSAFLSLSGELSAGAFAFEKDSAGHASYFTVINMNGNDVLAMDVSGNLSVKKAGDLQAVPPNIDVKVGDIVKVPFVSNYTEVKATEVDSKNGDIIGEYSWVGNTVSQEFFFGEIMK